MEIGHLPPRFDGRLERTRKLVDESRVDRKRLGDLGRLLVEIARNEQRLPLELRLLGLGRDSLVLGGSRPERRGTPKSARSLVEECPDGYHPWRIEVQKSDRGRRASVQVWFKKNAARREDNQ